MLGDIISAGAGLIGGLLAPKPDPARDFRQVFKSRMKMGDKYGISKLVMAGVPAPISTPQDNTIGQAVADMGAGVGRAVQANLNQTERAIARAQLDKVQSESELVKAQARNINLRTIREASPPVPTPSVFGHRMEPPAMTTHVRGGGYNLPTSTAWSDAATFENRYGETISDWLVGPAIGVTDLYKWSTAPSGNAGARDTYRPLDRSRPHKPRYYSGGYF